MSIRSDYPVSKSNHVSKESVDLFIIFGYLTWVESDFKVPNLPLSLRLKVSG
jgi:hypothetical protein